MIQCDLEFAAENVLESERAGQSVVGPALAQPSSLLSAPVRDLFGGEFRRSVPLGGQAAVQIEFADLIRHHDYGGRLFGAVEFEPDPNAGAGVELLEPAPP